MINWQAVGAAVGAVIGGAIAGAGGAAIGAAIGAGAGAAANYIVSGGSGNSAGGNVVTNFVNSVLNIFNSSGGGGGDSDHDDGDPHWDTPSMQSREERRQRQQREREARFDYDIEYDPLSSISNSQSIDPRRDDPMRLQPGDLQDEHEFQEVMAFLQRPPAATADPLHNDPQLASRPDWLPKLTPIDLELVQSSLDKLGMEGIFAQAYKDEGSEIWAEWLKSLPPRNLLNQAGMAGVPGQGALLLGSLARQMLLANKSLYQPEDDDLEEMLDELEELGVNFQIAEGDPGDLVVVNGDGVVNVLEVRDPNLGDIGEVQQALEYVQILNKLGVSLRDTEPPGGHERMYWTLNELEQVYIAVSESALSTYNETLRLYDETNTRIFPEDQKVTLLNGETINAFPYRDLFTSHAATLDNDSNQDTDMVYFRSGIDFTTRGYAEYNSISGVITFANATFYPVKGGNEPFQQPWQLIGHEGSHGLIDFLEDLAESSDLPNPVEYFDNLQGEDPYSGFEFYAGTTNSDVESYDEREYATDFLNTYLLDGFGDDASGEVRRRQAQEYFEMVLESHFGPRQLDPSQE